LNLNLIVINVAQSKKIDPGQITVYAGFFCNGFAEIKRKTKRHARPIVRPTLPLASPP
jgi:hypothetical protein